VIQDFEAWQACRASPVIWAQKAPMVLLGQLVMLAIQVYLVRKDIEVHWASQVSEVRLAFQAYPVCLDDKARLAYLDATERMDDQAILVNLVGPEDLASMGSLDFWVRLAILVREELTPLD